MSSFRQIIFCFSFLMALPSWASSSFETEWSLSSDMDNVKVWQLKANSDVTGSWQEKKPSKKLDWSNGPSETFFKSFEANKMKMLSFVGIREWKADKYQWKKLPLGHELKIEGHYVDSNNQKIAFSELHYFQELKTIQILQTRPFTADAKYTEDFFQFISKELSK